MNRTYVPAAQIRPDDLIVGYGTAVTVQVSTASADITYQHPVHGGICTLSCRADTAVKVAR